MSNRKYIGHNSKPWLDWICLMTTHVLQDILAVLFKFLTPDLNVITRHRFWQQSPNLHQTRILRYFWLVLKMGVFDLDLQGHLSIMTRLFDYLMAPCNFHHIDRNFTIHHWLHQKLCCKYIIILVKFVKMTISGAACEKHFINMMTFSF